MPIFYDEHFLTHLQDKYITIEIWKRGEDHHDHLIGITKLPLHRFYVIYRNSEITARLLKNQVIGLY